MEESWRLPCPVTVPTGGKEPTTPLSPLLRSCHGRDPDRVSRSYRPSPDSWTRAASNPVHLVWVNKYHYSRAPTVAGKKLPHLPYPVVSYPILSYPAPTESREVPLSNYRLPPLHPNRHFQVDSLTEWANAPDSHGSNRQPTVRGSSRPPHSRFGLPSPPGCRVGLSSSHTLVRDGAGKTG